MVLEKVDIQHELNFEELSGRLRGVRLRGFPDVKIYEDASFRLEKFSLWEVFARIFTPQPSIYQDHLDRIKRMDELFREKGIDIFNLNGGFDYVATDDKREETNWTIIPPVVERLPIEIKSYKGFAYSDVYAGLMAPELKKRLGEQGLKVNSELENLAFENANVVVWMDTICDGSHRIHQAVGGRLGQTLLMISGMKEGYPYYAVPKPYSQVHVEPTRIEEKLDKTHILESPGHKLLYRLFPSGGIHSGDVRSKNV